VVGGGEKGTERGVRGGRGKWRKCVLGIYILCFLVVVGKKREREIGLDISKRSLKTITIREI
jgi:hypothetical protein